MKKLAVLIAIGILAAAAPAAWAQAVQAAKTPRLRVTGALGVDLWSELADLEPFLGGDFDEAGIGVEINLHGGGFQWGPATVYLGADLGVLNNSSNVEGTEEGEDLQASLVYLTPSIKFLFGSPERVKWFLDAGFGYYEVSIEEWEDDCFFDCDIYEYYDDDAFGGHVGFGLDFPLGGNDDGFRLTTGARVHFVEFDEPGAVAPAGSLDGPIYLLYFGAGFDW